MQIKKVNVIKKVSKKCSFFLLNVKLCKCKFKKLKLWEVYVLHLNGHKVIGRNDSNTYNLAKNSFRK